MGQHSLIGAPSSHSIGVQAAFAFYTAGFYVYSLLVERGMSPFLGGYLVLGAAICVPLLLWPYASVLARGAFRSGIDALFWFVLIFYSVWMLVNSADMNHPAVFKTYAGSLIMWAMLFMLGRLIPLYPNGMGSLSLVIYGLISALILINTKGGAFAPALGADAHATYQAYAVIFCIVLFTLFYQFEGKLFFTLLAVASIILMAIIGSRSELVALLMMYLLISNLHSRTLQMVGLQVAGFIVLAAGYVYLMTSDWNRFFNLVQERAESTVLARRDATLHALHVIERNPLTGSIGNYLDEGLYAHNLLSIWVDFGFLGLVFYVAALGAPMLLLLSRGGLLSSWKTVVVLSAWLACATLLLLAKSGDYASVPFIAGLVTSHALLKGRRHDADPAVPGVEERASVVGYTREA